MHFYNICYLLLCRAQEEIVLEMIAVLVSEQLSHPPFPVEEQGLEHMQWAALEGVAILLQAQTVVEPPTPTQPLLTPMMGQTMATKFQPFIQFNLFRNTEQWLMCILLILPLVQYQIVYILIVTHIPRTRDMAANTLTMVHHLDRATIPRLPLWGRRIGQAKTQFVLSIYPKWLQMEFR